MFQFVGRETRFTFSQAELAGSTAADYGTYTDGRRWFSGPKPDGHVLVLQDPSQCSGGEPGTGSRLYVWMSPRPFEVVEKNIAARLCSHSDESHEWRSASWSTERTGWMELRELAPPRLDHDELEKLLKAPGPAPSSTAPPPWLLLGYHFHADLVPVPMVQAHWRQCISPEWASALPLLFVEALGYVAKSPDRVREQESLGARLRELLLLPELEPAVAVHVLWAMHRLGVPMSIADIERIAARLDPAAAPALSQPVSAELTAILASMFTGRSHRTIETRPANFARGQMVVPVLHVPAAPVVADLLRAYSFALAWWCPATSEALVDFLHQTAPALCLPWFVETVLARPECPYLRCLFAHVLRGCPRDASRVLEFLCSHPSYSVRLSTVRVLAAASEHQDDECVRTYLEKLARSEKLKIVRKARWALKQLAIRKAR